MSANAWEGHTRQIEGRPGATFYWRLCLVEASQISRASRENPMTRPASSIASSADPRSKLAGPALRAFFSIAERWRLTPDQLRTPALFCSSNGTPQG